MPERNKYITGLRAWSGFLQTGIECERGSRYTAKTRVSLSKLFKLAFDGIFSFSYIPLRISIVIGLLSSILAFITALFYTLRKTIYWQSDSWLGIYYNFNYIFRRNNFANSWNNGRIYCKNLRWGKSKTILYN